MIVYILLLFQIEKALFICVFLLSLCYGGYANTHVKGNVVFQKVNDVHLTEGRWLVTIIHDLKPYKEVLNALSNDLATTNSIITGIENWYRREHISFVDTFQSLGVEVDILNSTIQSVDSSFQHIATIGKTSNVKLTRTRSMVINRDKRSLVPIVGQALSFLFGTVSDNDLENINKNIETLA